MDAYMTKPFLLRMNLQLFAGEGGAGGGAGGDGGSGGEGGGAGGGEKTFTQAELDAAVTSRLSRAEKSAKTALAKELGYDSVEAMQAALKKPDQKDKDGQEQTLSAEDVDKRVKELLESGQKEQADKTFQRLLRGEVKVLASELGFADWEDAFKLSDLSNVKENDKGDIEGVKEALEELLKKKPHLGKQKTGNGAFGAQVGGGSGGGDDKARREALIKEAQGRGVIPQNQTVHNPWS